MTYFKLNIPKLETEISNYKILKKKYFDDVILAHRTLSNIQVAWNDSNSKIFFETVKKNANNCVDYFEYLDNLYGELDIFKKNIDEICHKFGFKYNSVLLKFDDSEIAHCKRYLSNAVYYLNNILNDIDANEFGDEYKNALSNFLYQIRKIRARIKNVLNNIEEFSKLINNEILSSKIRFNRIEKFEGNFKLINYNPYVK